MVVWERFLRSGSSRRWRLWSARRPTVGQCTAISRRENHPRYSSDRHSAGPHGSHQRWIKNSLSGRLGGSRGHQGRVYRPNLSPNSHPAVIWRPVSRPSGDHFALLSDPWSSATSISGWLTPAQKRSRKGQKNRERIENGSKTDLGQAGERPVRVRGEGRIRRCLDGRLRSPTQRR